MEHASHIFDFGCIEITAECYGSKFLLTVEKFRHGLYVRCIQTGKVKACAKQLEANPKAEICAFAGGKWVRVAGKLIADDRREAKKAMLDAYPSLRGMYNEDDGNTIVYYFEDAEATFSSFAEAPKTVQF